MDYPTDNVIVYDIETYQDYFLVGFEMPTGEYYQYKFEKDFYGDEIAFVQLNTFLCWARDGGYTLAGFNSNHYDDRVLSEFLADPRIERAYAVSVDIIQNDVPHWKFRNDIEAIDLMPLLPGRLSLKKVGVCLGHEKLQELPIAWYKSTMPQDRLVLWDYNRNDLDITRKLLGAVSKDLNLRGEMSRQYDVDLRSMGDATMAEAILLAEYHRSGGTDTKKQLNEIARATIAANPLVQVKVPSWWEWACSVVPQYPDLGIVIEVAREIFAKQIPVIDHRLPKGFLDRTVFVGDRYYKMGVGGLHSVDGPGAWIPDEDEILLDIDVGSYYPNIALTQGLAPRHWGGRFTPIYQSLVSRRLVAKASGDEATAYSLKIAVNGVFGKSSEQYSSIYDPQMFVNITVLGQLGLLLLIAMLARVGNVVSANTDGITVLAKKVRLDSLKQIVAQWESVTGFAMDYNHYAGFWQKDVNNYVALTTEGKLKTKGRFVCDWPDLRHTPNANIVAVAIGEYLKNNIPVAETIQQCTDINQFLLTQAVNKNWTTSWNGQPLGNMLRFYKSNAADAAAIMRHPGPNEKGNEGVVPDSDACRPVEDLPISMPLDLNYAWYIREAEDLQALLINRKIPGRNCTAEYLHQAGFRPCYVDLGSEKTSTAQVAYGESDFTSVPGGKWGFGTKSGDGLLVIDHGDDTEVLRVVEDYPTKTRKKIQKDYGFTMYYGARVPLRGFRLAVAQAEKSFDEFYTPAELKKVGR